MSDKTKSRNKKSHKSKKPETFVSGFKYWRRKRLRNLYFNPSKYEGCDILFKLGSSIESLNFQRIKLLHCKDNEYLFKLVILSTGFIFHIIYLYEKYSCIDYFIFGVDGNYNRTPCTHFDFF
jgi:hypothetical protein